MSDNWQTPAPGSVPGAAPTPLAAAPRRGNGGLMALAAILAVMLLVVTGTTIYLVVRSEPSEAGEVFLEPAAAPGPDPFTTAIPVASLPSTTSTTTTTTAPTTTTTGATTAVTSTSGGTPGLYGGTQNNSRCDPNQLVAFLETNPDKAAAWVQALNSDPSLRWSGGTTVQVSQIRAYVAELTPLTLTTDVRVTNYGYVNGRPTPRQAVLQRGTAVLVDKYGVPRTKCGCGNPLTAPVPTKKAPAYRGDPWPGWNPTTVVVVQQTTVVINTFVIVNFDGGGYLERPAGTTGGSDTVATSTPPSTGPTTTPPTSGPTTTPTTAPPTTASTAPVPTLAPQEFCTQYQTLVAKWANVSSDSPAQRAALLADLDTLAAAAPGDVQADMKTVIDYVRPSIQSGSIPDFPADIQAASDRVEAYLKTACGVG